jgi:hypothetical protein
MKIHSTIAVLGTLICLHAQTPPAEDPYVIAPPASNVDGAPVGHRNISVCCETFSVPIALAAKLHRERKTDAELYALLGTANEKEGIRQESFEMVRLMSGNKALHESFVEEIFPTEFERPALPRPAGTAVPPSKPAAAPVPSTNLSKATPPSAGAGILPSPATPSSFNTRNVGSTFEVEATMGESPADPFVDLRLSPEFVTLTGRDAWGQGISQAEMPVFESQRINTAMTMRKNQPTLIGTVSRPPVSHVDPDSANRIWFAFVTVKAVQP